MKNTLIFLTIALLSSGYTWAMHPDDVLTPEKTTITEGFTNIKPCSTSSTLTPPLYVITIAKLCTADRNDKKYTTALIKRFLENHHNGINNTVLIDQLPQNVQGYAREVRGLAKYITYDHTNKSLSFQDLQLNTYGMFCLKKNTHDIRKTIKELETTCALAYFKEDHELFGDTGNFVVNNLESTSNTPENLNNNHINEFKKLAKKGCSYNNKRRKLFTHALFLLHKLYEHRIQLKDHFDRKERFRKHSHKLMHNEVVYSLRALKTLHDFEILYIPSEDGWAMQYYREPLELQRALKDPIKQRELKVSLVNKTVVGCYETFRDFFINILLYKKMQERRTTSY